MQSTSRHLSQCQKRQVTHNTGARVFTVTSARHTGRVHPVGHQSLLACHRLWIWAFPRDSTASSNLTSFRGTQSHMVETPTRVSCPAGRSTFHTPPRPDAWPPSGPRTARPPLPPLPTLPQCGTTRGVIISVKVLITQIQDNTMGQYKALNTQFQCCHVFNESDEDTTLGQNERSIWRICLGEGE